MEGVSSYLVKCQAQYELTIIEYNQYVLMGNKRNYINYLLSLKQVKYTMKNVIMPYDYEGLPNTR